MSHIHLDHFDLWPPTVTVAATATPPPTATSSSNAQSHHLTPHHDHKRTQHNQGRAGCHEQERGPRGDCGGRVPITSIPHSESYRAVCSVRASPSSSRKKECPIRGGMKSHLPPHFPFSLPTDGTQECFAKDTVIITYSYITAFLHL